MFWYLINVHAVHNISVLEIEHWCAKKRVHYLDCGIMNIAMIGS